MRRVIAFPCAGETLFGSLDEAQGEAGLLIVSGGSEIRCGAHRGMAMLAQRLAAVGIPVFRFDRRGIGDSTGENCGFLSSAPDIAAAAATFAAETGIRRLVAFGNCDAATALLMFHQSAGIDALVLANPWVVDRPDDLPPAAAIRARYINRLRDPAHYARLLRGEIDLGKVARGIGKLLQRPGGHGALAAQIRVALNTAPPVTLILAERDATAIAFATALRGAPALAAAHIIDTDSHSFAREGDQAALETIVCAALG